LLINGVDEKTLEKAIKRFNEIKWKRSDLISQARKFSREKFEENIRLEVRKYEK
jgi:hypothetical protein